MGEGGDAGEVRGGGGRDVSSDTLNSFTSLYTCTGY